MRGIKRVSGPVGRAAWFAAAIFLALPAAVFAASPDQIEGLVAWYKVESLHHKLRGGEEFTSWPDSSGNGHHLMVPGDSRASIFETEKIGGMPTVYVRDGSAYSVTSPFELRDHTIFLAYRAHASERALFRSDVAPNIGILLHAGETRHDYRTGGMVSPPVPYNKASASRDAFGITVLGRDSGKLRSFVNGIEGSSGATLTGPVRVGQFFDLTVSTMVARDGEGLQIGEMLFYDRFLKKHERDEIVEQLAKKYKVELGDEVSLKDRLEDPEWVQGAALARLGTSHGADLNVQRGSLISWDRPSRLDAPFGHDPEENNSRLYCTRDGTRLRVYLSIPLEAAQPETRVRVLLLKNDRDFHDEEASSEPFGGPEDRRSTTVEFEATLFLDEGEFIEVVTFRHGAEGTATLGKEGGVFVVEAQ